MVGGVVFACSARPGKRPQQRPRGAGVEDQAGVGGVVVGVDDDGALGVGRPDLGHHVLGGWLGSSVPAEELMAGGDVVGGRRGAGQPDQRPEEPSAARGQGARRRRQPDGPPVAAVCPFRLDPHARAGALEVGGNQFGRVALALGGRGPVDARQALDPRPQLRLGHAPLRYPPRGRRRLHLLQDHRGRAPRREARRGRAHVLVHGHQPVDPRARAGDPQGARPQHPRDLRREPGSGDERREAAGRQGPRQPRAPTGSTSSTRPSPPPGRRSSTSTCT